MNAGPVGTNGGAGRQPPRPRRRPRHRRRHPAGRLRDRLADGLPEPGRRRSSAINVGADGRPQAARGPGRRRRARGPPRARRPRSRRPATAGTSESAIAAGSAELKTEWDGIVDEPAPPADGAPGRPRPGRGDRHRQRRASAATPTVVCAAGSLPGDLLRLWRAEDPEGLPRRVRLLVHGLRDRRPASASGSPSPSARSSSWSATART